MDDDVWPELVEDRLQVDAHDRRRSVGEVSREEQGPALSRRQRKNLRHARGKALPPLVRAQASRPHREAVALDEIARLGCGHHQQIVAGTLQGGHQGEQRGEVTHTGCRGDEDPHRGHASQGTLDKRPNAYKYNTSHA